MVCVFICVSPRSNTGGFYFTQEDVVSAAPGEILFGNKMCNILHYSYYLLPQPPLITSKCVIYYTFVLHFPPVFCWAP